jgi:hypothetical protein
VATPAPSASPVAFDWVPVLEGLDAARAEAFAAGTSPRWTRVYAAGSPGWPPTPPCCRRWSTQRQTAHGLRHEVRSVRGARRGAPRELRVVDVLAPTRCATPPGAVVSRAPARGRAAVPRELTRTAGGWRLVQVRPEA